MTQSNSNRTLGNGSLGDTALADNPMTEDALDQVIEHSFPASDPPSHTPTTGPGEPKGVAEEPTEGRWSRKTLRIAAACAAVAVVLTGLVAVLWRRRSQHWAHGIGLSGRTPSAVTIGARVACLSSFYKFLIRMGMLISNPCDALERPKIQPSPARGYTATDVQKILAVIPETIAAVQDQPRSTDSSSTAAMAPPLEYHSPNVVTLPIELS